MDQTQTFVTACAGLVALAMLCAALLRGWQGWLALKARELDATTNRRDTAEHRGEHPRDGERAPLAPTGRIELADLRERVRRLEAIAAGVDL